MFNYYDERLKTRLNYVKKKTKKNSDTSQIIFEQAKAIFNYIKWDEQQKMLNQSPYGVQEK